LVSITVSAAISAAEAESDHLICNVALRRHYPRQRATIAVLALDLILDTGRAHEVLELLCRAIRERSFLTASSAIARFRCIVTNDPVLNAL
jgi:hypothetical protein